MRAHTGFGPRDRWRLRENRWWILAAVLGAASIHSLIGIVHDTSSRHVAANLVRQSTAERIASYAASRLTAIALETFLPVATSGGDATPRAQVGALAAHQRAASRCACRDTLPAQEFFRVDLGTGGLELELTSGAKSPSPALLVSIARADAAREAARPLVHLTTSRALGPAGVVTYVQFDSASSPRAVFGLVAPAERIGQALFADADRATTVVDMGRRMVTMDSVSLLATGPDSIRLFGALDSRHRFVASLRPANALAGVDVAVALSAEQINPALLSLVPTRLLWHNGFLLVSTTLAVIFAIGSARREALLARTRSDFVAGVSHDLRMPLAQILLAGETLVAHGDAPARERSSLANAIVRESRRLATWVENLLLFSRSGAVRLEPRLQAVRVDEVFAGVVEAVELAADDARQTIDAAPVPSVAVLADPHLLRQALVNLVDNAIKYGPPGQRVRLGAEAVSSSVVRLVVDDEGPGIPAADRSRLFEPYQRLGRDQTSERTGTGLGLSVVSQIVRACKGRVWLDDNPAGRGTRAVIELTAASMPSPAAAAVEAT